MNLDSVYAYLDEQTRDVPIGPIAVVLALSVIVAVVWVLRRLPDRSIERADVAMWEAEVCAHIGHQAYSPELDEGTDRLLADLHDVFPEETS